MIERYRKTSNVIYTLGTIGVLVSAALILLNIISNGIGSVLIILTLFFVSMYQSWIISKLFKQLKEKEKHQKP